MHCYLVGGAVRDALLGLETKDYDYVVVGTTPAEMVRAGFRPVGKEFPVFIHPHTGAEYALARSERKIAKGYQGFLFHTDPDITLEQDLIRRDLTINAMAQAVDANGTIQSGVIDPYGGQNDLRKKILRHISPAFAEDPVRILRLARFAARFYEFSIAPETLELMQKMVTSGEVDALVAERIWQELAKGLMENHPAQMFFVLQSCGALHHILPELEGAWLHAPLSIDAQTPVSMHESLKYSAPTPSVENKSAADNGAQHMQILDSAAQTQATLPMRFAILVHVLHTQNTSAQIAQQQLAQLCQRLRVPKECVELARLVMVAYPYIARMHVLNAAEIIDLFQRCDLWRKPKRWEEIFTACLLIAAQLALTDGDKKTLPFATYMQQLQHAACAVNVKEIAASYATDNRSAISEAIRKARIHAVSRVIDQKDRAIQ